MFKLQAMKSKMAGTVCMAAAVGLLGVTAFASPALAAVDIESAPAGGTDVTLRANDGSIPDGEGGYIDTDLQLYVTVPTEIPGYIQPNGDVVFPDAEIINDSAFAIHVSKATVTEANGYNLVDSAGFASSNLPNALQMDISGLDMVKFIGGEDTPGGSLEMKAGTGVAGTGANADDSNVADLITDGQIKNVNDVPTTATKAYDIVWTVAAGANNNS